MENTENVPGSYHLRPLFYDNRESATAFEDTDVEGSGHYFSWGTIPACT